MLDLRRLKVFRDVARRGSFSAAATEMNFSPSAVGQQIAQLEREVGARLVERKSTGVALTPAGQRLLAHANAILAHAAEAEEELRQLGNGSFRPLRVAAFASAAASLMPAAIVAFRTVEPRVAIELCEQDREESLDQIRHGELDVAVLVRAADPDTEAGAVVMPLLDDYFDVLLPADHRLADQAAVSLQDLRDDPWADSSGQPVRHNMAALGIEPNVVFSSDHHSVLEEIVAERVAVALVPRLAQPVTRKDVVIKPIAPERRARRVGVAVRDLDPQPPAVKTMVEVLHRVAASRSSQDRVIPTRQTLARA